MTGKAVIDASRGRGLEGLADWMKVKLKNPDGVVALLDPALASGPELPMVALATMCEVADGCIQENARDRPNMLEVVRALTGVLQFCE
eukprot:gene9660-8483_t